MHTSEFCVEEFDSVCVHHHGDWSGDVLVVWSEDGERREVKLPGRLLLDLGKHAAFEAVRDRLLELLEQMEAP